MNPFNTLWLVLSGLLAGAGSTGALLGSLPPTAAVGVMLGLWVMIVGQTIGVDRAERDWNQERRALLETRESPPQKL